MDFDLKKIISQAKQLHTEMEKSKEKLEEVITTGSAGADMVQVVINGVNKVLEVKISDELFTLNNKKMLEDLVVAAFNNAVDNAQVEIKKEMSKITGGFPPGFMDML